MFGAPGSVRRWNDCLGGSERERGEYWGSPEPIGRAEGGFVDYPFDDRGDGTNTQAAVFTEVLRSLVVEVLLDKPSEKVLFHVWREGQQRADAAAGDSASFQMEEDQVIAEWHMLVQAAKTPSAYLSSFHAFVLANVLRRPILVYGDRFVRGRNGEPYAPSDVRGVYLPTLVDPDVCYKLPIAVGYTCVTVGKVGHFTALVGVDGELRHLPLVDEHGDGLPIRYGLPPATVANPRPEEDFLEDYLMTTLFYTEEGKQYPMAVLRGAYMTPEAADVRAAMAQTAVTAFDRLAKEQEEEIKRALLASEGENDNPPIPIPTPTPTRPPATTDGDGDKQGPTQSPPGPPVPLAPSEAKLPPPPPAPPAATATKHGDGLCSWSASSTTDLSDGPTAGLFVDDGNGERDKGAVAGGGGPTAIAGGGGGGAVALRGGGAEGGEAGSAGAAPRADSAAALLSAACYDDGSGGGGDAVGVPAGEAGRPSGEEDTDGRRARLERPESSPRAEGNGGGVDGGIGGGGSEDSPPVASPPIGSRLLSAPLDMLSAVGAWATGRGRYSVGSAASDTAAAAAAVATATATAASSSLSDGGRTASSSDSISSTAAGGPPASPRSGNGVGSRTGGSGGAGDGARPGKLAGASPLDLRLDDFSGHGAGDDGGASASGMPRSVHVPGEEEGMGLNSPPPNGNGEAEVAATTNGKRKPACSPAITPEGANPGQHFGDARSTAAASATAGVEEDWRVANTAAAPGSRRRSKGRNSTGTAGPPPPPARRASAVAGADDTAAAAGQEEGEEKPGESTGVAASVRAFAAATEAYHATERWRSARSGGAGSRRGQPHPRGSSPGGDGEAATGGRSSIPWLATSSLAIAAAERRPQGESRADEVGRRLAAGGGSSSHDGGGGGGATGARAGGGVETRPETAPPKARYHSRTRRPRGEDPSGAPFDRYPLTERGSRSVQDGIDTMSLARSIASGERRYHSSGRLPHVAAVAAGANHDFDLGGGHGGSSSWDAYHLPVEAATSPTRRRRASAAGGGTQSAGRRESSNPSPPRELSDYRLYPRSTASTTEARARRAGAGEGEARSSRGMSSSSPLSRDGGLCSFARSSSGGGGGGGGGGGVRRDVGDGFAGAGDEGGEWRNRGESAGYYSYGGSSYSYGARAGSSTASLSRQLSGSERSPSPAFARPSSAYRKSDYLRAAGLTRPGSSSSSLSRAALTGRRSPLRTSISSSSSSVSASSYLASRQLGTAASAAGFPSNVPGAVLTQQQGLSARGGLPARAGSGGGGGGSVRSNGSVRSGRSYSGSCSGSNAGYDGQTLSEIRRSLAARERREVEATSVGAPRSRTAYVDTPKFY
ncbi:unnamed protein product [Ectocarpus sp. CCAP 1310/34]|nr:unnamed protein product [Ectocarpus sp. CCAP 1310/34]